jgi:hypothetical protein
VNNCTVISRFGYVFSPVDCILTLTVWHLRSSSLYNIGTFHDSDPPVLRTTTTKPFILKQVGVG